MFTEWRLEETAEINANLTGPQRKAALSMLLEQETQLIAAINRHKNDSDKVNKEKAIKAFLDKVGGSIYTLENCFFSIFLF